MHKQLMSMSNNKLWNKNKKKNKKNKSKRTNNKLKRKRKIIKILTRLNKKDNRIECN